MADYISLKTNEILFNEGDESQMMFIVRTGQIAVFTNDGNKEKILSIFGTGELIGELSLFDKRNRSASARAVCDSSLVLLPYENLEKQLDTLPSWVRITMRTLSDKLRMTNQKLVE